MILIPLALLIQSADAAPAPQRTIGALDEVRFEECHDAAIDDPATGVIIANDWLADGGGYLARQCLGFAHARQGQFAIAAEIFAQAASGAEVARDWRSANLWAQAGNAALAAGQPESARTHLTAALAQGSLTGLQLGEAYLDRARAAAALEDWAAARADIDRAIPLASQDPLVWLLSATLARRQDDLVRAAQDIATAAQLGPRDAAIALEAGNIAVTAENYDTARTNWQAAADLAGTSPIGAVARARLRDLAEHMAQQDREAVDAPLNLPERPPTP